MLLSRDGADEVVASSEEGVRAELEVEGSGGSRGEEEQCALEVGFGVVEIVGAIEEDVGEAKPGADLDEG